MFIDELRAIYVLRKLSRNVNLTLIRGHLRLTAEIKSEFFRKNSNIK